MTCLAALHLPKCRVAHRQVVIKSNEECRSFTLMRIVFANATMAEITPKFNCRRAESQKIMRIEDDKEMRHLRLLLLKKAGFTAPVYGEVERVYFLVQEWRNLTSYDNVTVEDRSLSQCSISLLHDNVNATSAHESSQMSQECKMEVLKRNSPVVIILHKDQSQLLKQENGTLLELGVKVGDPFYMWIIPPALTAATDVVLNFAHVVMYGTVMDYISDAAINEVASKASEHVAKEAFKQVVKDMNKWPKQVSPLLAKKMTDWIKHNITRIIRHWSYGAISRGLTPTIADRIARDWSNNIRKSLSRAVPILTSTPLIQSITHAITPTLVHILGSGGKQAYSEFCQECYWTRGQRCADCPLSLQSLYYQIYHSTYYADYYGTYYSNYYTSALIALDQKMYEPYIHTAT